MLFKSLAFRHDGILSLFVRSVNLTEKSPAAMNFQIGLSSMFAKGIDGFYLLIIYVGRISIRLKRFFH